EYPLAIHRLRLAIRQAQGYGLLGEDILGSGFNFNVRVVRGGGAFVCGEETALIASVEGRDGRPRFRPPFPAQSGLWGKPTNINNVETWANVAPILLRGAEWFASLGTEKSKGTKIFSLVGKVCNSGLVEVPMGINIRKIVFDIGGGIPGGKEFKAVQIGGPSGGCIPKQLQDTLIDYESLTSTGAIMGSGGLVVMDEDTCMVDVARYFLEFTQSESCGKCTFCRVGTKRMLEILTRICNGEGRDGDIELLRDLAQKIKESSLCGLGQTAPNPVITTIKYFQSEYEAHIYNKKCPAKHCSKLVDYVIDPKACIGCTLCAKACPVNAISGERKQPHLIDQELCIKCSECYRVCPTSAVHKQ
nr:NADH-ubiquinone oxidoreductase-F iron-sulfur binding region domain-containing protein [bacterium]